jgi:hypothetical protein
MKEKVMIKKLWYLKLFNTKTGEFLKEHSGIANDLTTACVSLEKSPLLPKEVTDEQGKLKKPWDLEPRIIELDKNSVGLVQFKV